MIVTDSPTVRTGRPYVYSVAVVVLAFALSLGAGAAIRARKAAGAPEKTARLIAQLEELTNRVARDAAGNIEPQGVFGAGTWSRTGLPAPGGRAFGDETLLVGPDGGGIVVEARGPQLIVTLNNVRSNTCRALLTSASLSMAIEAVTTQGDPPVDPDEALPDRTCRPLAGIVVLLVRDTAGLEARLAAAFEQIRASLPSTPDGASGQRRAAFEYGFVDGPGIAAAAAVVGTGVRAVVHGTRDRNAVVLTGVSGTLCRILAEADSRPLGFDRVVSPQPCVPASEVALYRGLTPESLVAGLAQSSVDRLQLIVERLNARLAVARPPEGKITLGIGDEAAAFGGLLRDGTLQNAWGGSITAWVENGLWRLDLDNVPPRYCRDVLTYAAKLPGLFSGGVGGGVAEQRPPAELPAAAISQCDGNATFLRVYVSRAS